MQTSATGLVWPKRQPTRLAILAGVAGAGLVAGLIAVAAPAQAATGLTASFHVDSTWTGAYQGTYTITNNTAGTVTGWNVQFDLPSGSSLGNWWNANLTTSGQHVTAVNQDWNKSIAKGATASFGFLVNGTGMPAKCTINGGSCAGGPVDNTPPTTPTSLRVTATTSGSVSLAWTASTDNVKVVGYDVRLGGQTATTVTGTTATVDGLNANTTYSFTVVAKDAADNASTPSTAVSAKTLPCTSNCGGGSTLRVAPYIDMGSYPTPLLSQVSKDSTVKSFTLAFIVAGGNACKASWFNAFDPRTGWQLPEITKIRQAGGDVKISFGGEAGMELADACTDITALTAEYQAVVTAYKLKYIDFDIEGAAVANAASIDRRSKAIKKLETANPGLKVSLTLPVLPSGLDGNGIAVVKSAKANGLKIDVVNVMAMDYGSQGNGDYGTLANDAAKNTHSQLMSTFGISSTAAYRMVGITPMLGQNDDGHIFSINAAHTVMTFAKANHVGELAFWEVTRDRNACHGALYMCTNVTQTPYQFSKIFAPYTG
jgi:hypothetical protein